MIAHCCALILFLLIMSSVIRYIAPLSIKTELVGSLIIKPVVTKKKMSMPSWISNTTPWTDDCKDAEGRTTQETKSRSRERPFRQSYRWKICSIHFLGLRSRLDSTDYFGFGWKTCSRRFQPLTSCKCSCVALPPTSV